MAKGANAKVTDPLLELERVRVRVPGTGGLEDLDRGVRVLAETGRLGYLGLERG